MSDDKKKDDAEAKPKKKGKKGLIIIIAAVLLLAGGGGAGWFFFMKPKPDASADAEEDHKPAAHKEKGKVKTFATLDPFTVNLADEGGERFIQVAVVLEVADAKVSNDLTAQMPAVRNAVLMLLSSKLAKELLTVPGKERLAEEIAAAAGTQLGWEPPEDDEEEKPRKTKVKAAAEEHGEDKAEAKPEGEAKEGETKESAKAAKAEADKKLKKRKKRRSDPNPIEAVHFAQFIVQ